MQPTPDTQTIKLLASEIGVSFDAAASPAARFSVFVADCDRNGNRLATVAHTLDDVVNSLGHMFGGCTTTPWTTSTYQNSHGQLVVERSCEVFSYTSHDAIAREKHAIRRLLTRIATRGNQESVLIKVGDVPLFIDGDALAIDAIEGVA